MSRTPVAAVVLAVVSLALTSVLAADARQTAPASRKVYVTVVDGQGQPVPGLTVADFALKEGGRDRDITAVEPATAKMRIALAVEESLMATGGARQGIAAFVPKAIANADIALVVVGPTNKIVVPYTSDLQVFAAGLNALPLTRSPLESYLIEGIAELARLFSAERPERPVIVVIANDSQQRSNLQPGDVLDRVRESGAQLFTVAIDAGRSGGNAGAAMEMSSRSQVLGDGPKQSGGRAWPVTTPSAIPKAMEQIAGDLASQYAISYSFPAGVKPSGRLSVSLKKKGATLRAPTRVSDK